MKAVCVLRAKVDTPADVKAVYDDQPTSAAPVSLYEELLRRTGRVKAGVINGGDPLDEWSFEHIMINRSCRAGRGLRTDEIMEVNLCVTY